MLAAWAFIFLVSMAAGAAIGWAVYSLIYGWTL
jgi:hypothetical protein